MRIQTMSCLTCCLLLLGGLACSGNGSTQATTGGTRTATGGVVSGGSPSGGSPGTGGIAPTGGTLGTGGSAPTGGTLGTGGSAPTGGTPGTGGLSNTGGVARSGGIPGTGGLVSTGGSAITGGAIATGGKVTTGPDGGPSTGGSPATDGGTPSGCVPTKTWGTADPASPGPFEVVTETNVGPENGTPDAKWNNTKPHFNLYRPKDLSQGYCHPVITWANGTNDQPKTYEVLLKQLVSHGFVVVASLSSQTLSGNPLPQVAGVNWMVQENENPASPLYHRLDLSKIGATGHSQGGAATVASAVADARISAIAPIAGAYPLGAPVPTTTKVHGPAALLCGGKDTTIPCSLVEPIFKNINDYPVLFGNNLGDTHGSWIGSIKNPYMIAVTGWMRVHLMGDTANRAMFYGPDCTLCKDTQHWVIQRKMLDN